MASIIGALRAELSANIADFKGAMRQASQEVKGVDKASQDASRSGRGLGLALGAIVGVGIGAVLRDAANKIKLTGDSLETTGKKAVTLTDLLPAAVSLVGDQVAGLIKGIAGTWQDGMDAIKAGTDNGLDGTEKSFRATIGVILVRIVQFINVAIGLIVGLGTAIVFTFRDLGPAVKDAWATTINGVTDIVEAGLNRIIAAANYASGGLLKLAPVVLQRVANESKGAAGKLGKEVALSFQLALQKDYLGDMAGALIKRAGELQKKTKAKRTPISEAQRAFDSLEKTLDRLERRTEKGLDNIELPKSIAAANALRRELEDAMEAAKKAGAPIDKLNGRIKALQERINTLETQGLQKEAEKFAADVNKADRAVRDYASGGLPPLEKKLQEVDDKFAALRESIQKQIDDNTVLAERVPEAAAAMEQLKKALGDLEAAHKTAGDAARAQYEAEKKIADLQAQAAQNDLTTQVQDLQRARGASPILGPQAERLKQIEQDLAKQRIDGAIELAKLEADRAEAQRKGDEDEASRLAGIIAVRQELNSLLEETNAIQIDGAERLKSAYQQFTDSLSSELSDMIANWSGDLDGIRGIFKQLAKEIFLKPVTSAFSEGVGGFLSGLTKKFAGGFAAGGTLRPGQWGIAGENGPEPIYAGNSALTVVPGGQGMGARREVVQNFNISTPDANSFRLGERQIARAARQRLTGGA